MIPKPKLPQLDLDEELESEEVFDETEEEGKDEEGIAREKIVTSFSKLLGFVAAIGLPKAVMAEKINYYSQLAEETGVTEALMDTIEYYFPDVEMSPAIVLAVTGIAFASAVIADRQETMRKFQKAEKMKGRPVKQIKEQEGRKKKEGVNVTK